MDIVLAIAIAVVGAAMLINPEGVYRFTESWKSNTPGEPSDLYIRRGAAPGGWGRRGYSAGGAGLIKLT